MITILNGHRIIICHIVCLPPFLVFKISLPHQHFCNVFPFFYHQNLLVFNPDKRYNTQQSLAHSYFHDITNSTSNTTTNNNNNSCSQDSGISSQPCSAPLADEEVGGTSQDPSEHPSLLATDETLDSGIGSTTSSNNSHLLNMSNQSNSNVDYRSLSRTDSGICMSPTPSASSSVNNLSTCCSEMVSSGEYSSSNPVDKGNIPSTSIGTTDLVKDQSKPIVSDMNKNESTATSTTTTTDVGAHLTDSDLNSSNTSSTTDLNNSISKANIHETPECYISEPSTSSTTCGVKDLDDKILQQPKDQNDGNSAESQEKVTNTATKKRDNEDFDLPPSKMRRC